MTDRQMLERCLEAFAAIQEANSARRLLKKLGNPPGYGINGRDSLARHMTQELLKHLQTEKPV
jgi:hypothetical protein